MAIVGISGSPIIHGNTDRITRAILQESGRETNFINLSTLAFSPCRGFAHKCATQAMCSFFSRLWCFLHESNTLRNKPVVFVGVGIRDITARIRMVGFGT